MELLLEELLEDLSVELNSELRTDSDKAILSSKIKGAYRDIRRRRNYQVYHTHEFMDKDMADMYSIIKYLTLYDWNHIGGEGQTGHSENGTSRTWHSRDEILAEVIPFVQVL